MKVSHNGLYSIRVSRLMFTVPSLKRRTTFNYRTGLKSHYTYTLVALAKCLHTADRWLLHALIQSTAMERLLLGYRYAISRYKIPSYKDARASAILLKKKHSEKGFLSSGGKVINIVNSSLFMHSYQR